MVWCCVWFVVVEGGGEGERKREVCVGRGRRGEGEC